MKVLLLLSISAALVAIGAEGLKCHTDNAGTAAAIDCDDDFYSAGPPEDRCLTTYTSERVTSLHFNIM